MADFSHLVLQDILGAEIDFKSPIDEDLMLRLVTNLFSVAAMVDSQPNSLFKAQSNGIPTDGGATSVLTLDTITEGVFERDDQYNTKYILVTSGPASGNGVDSRFPITDCDEGALTFTVGENEIGENLNEAGMVDDNTFQVIGHVHDGVDGEKISAADLDTTNGPGFFPQNGILIWDQSNTCPTGFTRHSAFDDFFLQGATTRGGTGGNLTHNHQLNGAAGGNVNALFTNASNRHFITGFDNHLPPFYNVLFCRKD